MQETTPARALLKQLAFLTSHRNRIDELQSAMVDVIGKPQDLLAHQWPQLLSIGLEFKPDLIIELGRGYGNSTLIFTEVANQVGQPCKVVSICISDAWRTISYPKLSLRFGAEYFQSVECVERDIRAFDFAPVLKNAKRVLVFWDVHDLDVSRFLVSKLFPDLQNKEHLVLVHDTADANYVPEAARRYEETAFWLETCKGPPPLYRIGDLYSYYVEGVVLVDFAARNGIDLINAEKSFHTELTAAQRSHIESTLGIPNAATHGFWLYFSLQNAKYSLTFPTYVSDVATPVTVQPPLPPPRSRHRLGWISKLFSASP